MATQFIRKAVHCRAQKCERLLTLPYFEKIYKKNGDNAGNTNSASSLFMPKHAHATAFER